MGDERVESGRAGILAANAIGCGKGNGVNEVLAIGSVKLA